MKHALKAASTTAGVLLLAAVIPGTGHAATTSRASAHSSKPPIGDKCLVGTWRDKKVTQMVLFNNNLLEMVGKGGDVDHIHASGVDKDRWGDDAQPLHGSIGDDPVDEMINGVNKLSLHVTTKGAMEETEDGWSTGSGATFTYQGQTTTQPNQETGTGSAYYTCTTKKLTWKTAYGDVLGHEKRLSHKP
jgi:hypothetical protein